MNDTRKKIAQQLKVIAQNVVASNWQLPADNNWHWVQSSAGAKVARIEFCGEEFYFKAFLARNALDGIKSFFRGSRAQRFYFQSKALKLDGFYVPDVIVTGSKGEVSWVIMECVRGISWGDYVCSFLTRPQTPERLSWKRKLIAALGAEIGRLHKLGFVHGDLNPFNALVDASEKEVKFHLIDNERTRHPFYLLERERIRNLVQINFFRSPHMQRTDLLRFWIAYCESAGLTHPEWRLLIKAYTGLLARLDEKSDYKVFGNSHIAAERAVYLPG